MIDFFTSNLASGVFGAILGSFIGNWLSIKNEKVKLTMDFHKEWNSLEMSIQRRLGYHCIKSFPCAKYGELTDCDEKGSISVFTVLRFYERLWHCFDTNRVNRQLTATLFYQDFYWWYFISFSTSLQASKEDWPSYHSIESLKIKFKEFTSDTDYQTYERKYTEKYKTYVSNRSNSANELPKETTTNAIIIKGTGNFVISQEK